MGWHLHRRKKWSGWRTMYLERQGYLRLKEKVRDDGRYGAALLDCRCSWESKLELVSDEHSASPIVSSHNDNHPVNHNIYRKDDLHIDAISLRHSDGKLATDNYAVQGCVSLCDRPILHGCKSNPDISASVADCDGNPSETQKKINAISKLVDDGHGHEDTTNGSASAIKGDRDPLEAHCDSYRMRKLLNVDNERVNNRDKIHCPSEKERIKLGFLTENDNGAIDQYLTVDHQKYGDGNGSDGKDKEAVIVEYLHHVDDRQDIPARIHVKANHMVSSAATSWTVEGDVCSDGMRRWAGSHAGRSSLRRQEYLESYKFTRRKQRRFGLLRRCSRGLRIAWAVTRDLYLRLHLALRTLLQRARSFTTFRPLRGAAKTRDAVLRRCSCMCRRNSPIFPTMVVASSTSIVR
ncbi:hypothetical protein KP509_37G060500 [Ceratopteris richardii]|uniref:Uncharacterized protein n=1 Tax=Ceratopteris richardii TaxID=49495 RepID=A0A8T2Q9J9_CERRI|nr:hypothetical protein KP509_37G060500 [Ceratopteris richardii]